MRYDRLSHIDREAWLDGSNQEDSLWSFSTARFTVALYALPEDMHPRESFDDPRDVAFACEDDPAHWFCACVVVYNERGNSIEGHLRPRNGRINGRFAKRRHGSLGSYFPSMVRAAIDEARHEIGVKGVGQDVLAALSQWRADSRSEPEAAAFDSLHQAARSSIHSVRG